jgi:fructose-bisphosphate aldolase class I
MGCTRPRPITNGMDHIEIQKLKSTVAKMMTDGKGILAADESNTTCNKRFQALGIPEIEEERRRWRELLLCAPGMEEYVSGVILYDETIRQADSSGKSFVDVLKEKNILVGIKVDEGLQEYIDHPGENLTHGLNGLPARIQEYKSLGATFAKWRAAYEISDRTPSDDAIRENSEILARYAVICQEHDIVPMVEPEVLLDGAHDIEKAKEVTTKVLKGLFEALAKRHVNLDGLILKTSMVLSGKDAENRANSEEVAKATVEVLKECVPAEVGGVVFLSGGQKPDEATENFNAIAKHEPLPWKLAFSFSRAIQNDALATWAGKVSNIDIAREAFIARLKSNSLADRGLL